MTTETTTQEIIIGSCTCEVCGCEYDFEASGANFSDECPGCESRRLAEEAWEEAVGDAQTEVDEAEAELAGLLVEMEELKAKVAEAKAAVRMAAKRLKAAEAA